MKDNWITGYLLFCLSFFFGLYFQTVSSCCTYQFLFIGLLSGVWLIILYSMVLVPLAIVIGLVLLLLSKIKLLKNFLSRKVFVNLGLFVMSILIVQGLTQWIPEHKIKSELSLTNEQISDCEIIGYHSFLSRRWLIKFIGNKDVLSGLIDRFGLKEINSEKLNLSHPSRDFFLEEEWVSDFGQGRIGEIENYQYSKTEGYVTDTWIEVSYDETNQKFLIYKGYQN